MPNHTVAQLVRGLREKEFSSSELTRENTETQTFLDEAEQLADRAEAALQRGQNHLALELILAANKLLRASERSAGAARETEIASLRTKLDQLDRILEDADAQITDPGSEAYSLLDQAKILRFNAKEALELINGILKEPSYIKWLEQYEPRAALVKMQIVEKVNLAQEEEKIKAAKEQEKINAAKEEKKQG